MAEKKKGQEVTENPLVPDTPTIDVDYDKYGYCVVCHKDLRTTKMTSDGPVEMFTSDHSETELLLNDGSHMRVTICKKCKSQLNEETYQDLMRSVYKGWYMETQYLKKWDNKKKEDYLFKYLNKDIVCVAENQDNDTLEKKLSKYRQDKIKEKIGK